MGYGVYPHAIWKTIDPRTGDGVAVPTGQGYVDREMSAAVPYGRMEPIRVFARRADADKLASRLTFDLGLSGRESRAEVLSALKRRATPARDGHPRSVSALEERWYKAYRAWGWEARLAWKNAKRKAASGAEPRRIFSPSMPESAEA